MQFLEEYRKVSLMIPLFRHSKAKRKQNRESSISYFSKNRELLANFHNQKGKYITFLIYLCSELTTE